MPPHKLLHGRLVATVLASVLLLAPVHLEAQSGDGPVPSEEAGGTVEPGDRVQISMFSAAGDPLEQVSGTRRVDREGRLFLPFVGLVQVRGLGASEIRELLERRYADFYSNPVIDVETEIRVNVTGAVRQPGNYFVPPTSTIVDALATAGGTASEVEFTGLGGAADPSRVRLVRRGQPPRILDLRAEMADSTVLNMPVRSGDWLHVPPQSRSRWRSNLQLVSSFLSVVGSVAALIVLVGR